MLVVALIIEVQQGKKDEFLKLARVMADESKKEDGNIEYNVCEDLNNENIVSFIEKWKNKEALDIHEKMDYFVNNIGKLKALCAKPPQRYLLTPTDK